MKNYFVNYIMILAIYVFFSGCSDTKTNKFVIERSGVIEVNSVATLVDKYKDILNKQVILQRLDLTEGNMSLEEVYRITFPFKLVGQEINGVHSFGATMSIDLCDNAIITATNLNEPQLEPVLGEYTLNLSLERLMDKNLVSENESEQKNICIYFNEEIHDYVNSYVKSESNTVTFTAEEINAARAEYERLTQ